MFLPSHLTHVLYEQGINVHLAKKMIEDRSRDYMNARRVAKVTRARENLIRRVKNTGLSFGKLNPVFWISGVRDCDEGAGQERALGTTPELPSGSSAGGNVEEVHPVGKKQPAAHRRPDPHHQER